MKNMLIPVEALEFVHQWLPFDAGNLYPFGLKNGAVSGRIESMLAKGGFLSENGKITEEAKETLRVISTAKKTAKLRFLADGDLLDYQVFFSSQQPASVSLKRSEASFILQNPAPTEEIIDVLADFSGTGKFGVIQSEFAINPEESLVLAAIIDLIRRRIFLFLANNEDSFETNVTQEELKMVFQRDELGANWLVWVMNSFLPAEMELRNLDINRTIESLSEKSLVKTEEKSILPSEEVVFLSRRLLHLNCLYMLDSFKIKEDGSGIKSRLSVVQNGIRDLLLLETDGKLIAWKGISGNVLFSILYGVLDTVKAGKDVPVKTNQPEPAENLSKPMPKHKNNCPKCFSNLKPKARFCSKCGETIKL